MLPILKFDMYKKAGYLKCAAAPPSVSSNPSSSRRAHALDHFSPSIRSRDRLSRGRGHGDGAGASAGAAEVDAVRAARRRRCDVGVVDPRARSARTGCPVRWSTGRGRPGGDG